MIYQLMKRDLAWKAIPWATAGLILLWLFSLLRTPRELSSVIFAAVCSILLILIMGMASNQDIWSSLLSALPVTPREIYLARVLALLTLLWMPVFADTALQAAMRAPSGPAPFPVLGAYATLFAIAVQSAMMTGVSLPKWVVMTLLAVSIAGPIPLMALQRRLAPYEAPFAGVCLAGAAAIFLRTWNFIDGSPLASPRKPATYKAAAVRHSRPHSLLRICIRSFYSRMELLWVVILFSQAAIGVWLNGILFLWSLPFLGSRRWLDPLPVSRRKMVLAGILPPLLSLTAGYLTAIGMHSANPPTKLNDISETTSQSWPPSAQQVSCGRTNIMPPLEYWRVSKEGRVETATAPWGETFTPPLIAIMSTRVYNPYAVGCANTQAFFDWQFRRATTAVYGHPVTFNDFVHDRYQHPRPGLRMAVLNLIAMTTCAMLALVLGSLKDWYRSQRLPGWLPRSFVVIGVFGTMALVFWLGWPKMQEGLQWLSWHLPNNLAGLIAICAVPPLLLYLTLDKLAREAELTTTPAQTANFITQFQR